MRRNQLICFRRAPGVGFVADRAPLFQDRVYDAPCFLDIVFAREPGLVTRHRVAQQFLVGQHDVLATFLIGNQFNGASLQLVPSGFDRGPDGNYRIAADAKAYIVLRRGFRGENWARTPQLRNHLRLGLGQRFTRADKERNASPAPGINRQLQSHIGLGLRIRLHSGGGEITAILAADYILIRQRRHTLQDFDPLIAQAFNAKRRRRLHGDVAEYLQQMVLHHITHGSYRVVKAAPVQYIELLGHGDLNALHIEAVPDRLQEGISKAKEDHILHRVLAQVVIDTKDILFIKNGVDYFVQRNGRSQVIPKRLFDDHARALRRS